MTQKKPEISDRERERRARQAAQQAKPNGPSVPGQNTKQGGYNPAAVVPKHQKKAARGA